MSNKNVKETLSGQKYEKEHPLLSQLKKISPGTIIQVLLLGSMRINSPRSDSGKIQILDSL